MTTAAPRGAQAGPAPRKLWAFHAYAIITALIGIDLLMFPDRIAALMVQAPIVLAIMDIASWFQGLGVATLLFAGGIELAVRHDRSRRVVAPTMAVGAGACCLIAAAVVGFDLTGVGIAILVGCAAFDFLFAGLMARARV